MDINIITWATSRKEAEDKFSQYNPDLVILDLGMDFHNDREISNWLKNQPKVPKMMSTSFYDNVDYRNIARESGADGFLIKDNFKIAFPQLMQHLNNDFNKIFKEHSYILN